MPYRRKIENDDEYEAALKELARLEEAALGTPATTGLQGLVEAILSYEKRRQTRRRANGAGKLH